MDELDGKIKNLVNFGFLALIKIGVICAVISVVLALLRAQDHYAYVRADAEIINTSVQCEISAGAARSIAKRARWWDCETANKLQRAHPSVNLGISKSDHIEYRFTLPDGRIQTVSAEKSFFDVGSPEPGTSVPILYSRADPTDVRAVLRLEHWAALSLLGLLGMATGLAGWRLRMGRAELSARLAQWLRRVQDQSEPGQAGDLQGRSDPGSSDPVRSGSGRTLGVG